MKRFADKICLVTGAAAGIGRATALRLASEGASLAVADINEEGLRGLEAELAATDGACLVLRYDALDEASCRALAERCVQHYGRLDVLCNIAGACRADHFLELSLADWDRVFAINVRSLVAICQSALPHLASSRGNIVNMASSSGLCGAPYYTAYAASKAAVVSLGASLAVEFNASGVRVNTVCPGNVQTGLVDTYDFPANLDLNAMQRLYPMIQPSAEPGEIAAAVAYLASDEARFVTGVAFTIDGGQLC